MPPRSAPLQLLAAFRPALGPRLSLTTKRAMHDKIFAAHVVMADKNGSLLKRKFDITIGDPHEAWILLAKEEGFSLKSAIDEQIEPSSFADPEMVPLVFHHDSRHFAHHSLSYPRLIIGEGLPRQNSTSTSPATLWAWGATHCITLDGTADHDFHESARESYERLKGVAELLKDR